VERVNVALGYVRSDIAQDVSEWGGMGGHKDNVQNLHRPKAKYLWGCGQSEVKVPGNWVLGPVYSPQRVGRTVFGIVELLEARYC